ncbi:MAG TPA: 6-carboxytetrahydropterin synthase [Hyphomicrobiales bacterium]|nr:6-carboxytetrahydropterin synthase [Hyphomicrobiales bacterium]
MMQIYKEFGFEAAHRLPSAPENHPNARIHGHSFRVRVTIGGEPDPETGLIYHFEEFEKALAAAKRELDHRYLNEVEGLEVPTLERIAQWIWKRIEGQVPGLTEVRLSRPSCGEGCILSLAQGSGRSPFEARHERA